MKFLKFRQLKTSLHTRFILVEKEAATFIGIFFICCFRITKVGCGWANSNKNKGTLLS